MADDPFFPRPRTKDYREPGRTVELGEGQPAPDASRPRALVVHRPEDGALGSMEPAHRKLATDPPRGSPPAKTYSRPGGAAFALLGGVLLWSTVENMRNGHDARAVVGLFGLPLLAMGGFILIAGAPRDLRGRLPPSWTRGFWLFAVAGAVVGLALGVAIFLR